MNEKYRQELITWGVRTVIVILLTILSAMLQKYVGVTPTIDPVPVTVVVQPAPGSPDAPTVTVFPAPKEK